MVQNDENQDEDAKQAARAKEKAKESSAAPESAESKAKETVSRKLISAATLKEAARQIKELGQDAIKNPHAREAVKLQAYNLALAGLAAVELVPGVEVINDATKILSIAQGVTRQGKEKGFFKELYKDVPKGLMAFVEATDLANIPGAPILPEIIQSAVNQCRFYRESILFGKDMLKDASARVRNFSRPSPEVQAARLQFSPAMA